MNINKIKLSGTTYSIQDENACKVVELTQAEYDALPATAKTSNSLFVITDATAGDLSNYYTKSETDDLLDTKLDVSAYTPTDLSNYYTKLETSGATEISTALASKADTATTYTKTEVDNAITAATSAKQDTLVSGTNIKTINNESILGSGNIEIQGGGKTINAGRGIKITTGETADTVSLNVVNEYYGTVNLATSDSNVYNGSIMIGRSYIHNRDHAIAIGTTTSNVEGGAYIYGRGGIGIGNNVVERSSNGIAIGYFSSAGTSDMKLSCTAIGTNAESYGEYSTALSRTKVNNESEFGSGRYNVSSTASTTFGDSGNTLFSVGNGTSSSARHNAFEIRQNGDIYLTLDGQDVKLQDQLGGGSITVDTALDSGSTNPVENRVIYNKIDEVEQVTAAGLNALNESKQDTLVSGTNIKTINNESILGSGNIDIQGGGGKAIEAGRGIKVTTGETADTVSFNLPIYNGSGNKSIYLNSKNPQNYPNNASGENSFVVGTNNIASGSHSIAMGGYDNYGDGCSATTYNSFAMGRGTLSEGLCSIAKGYKNKATNQYEESGGRFNVSNKANTTFGDSGNTLFSVGNGTSDSSRHNAFEIRQNGDIYLTKDGQDVKLQDQLGGGGSSYTAGDGIDITNGVISVTGKVDTSAITTSITSASTNTQVPSAKAVYDMVGNINTILESI